MLSVNAIFNAVDAILKDVEKKLLSRTLLAFVVIDIAFFV